MNKLLPTWLLVAIMASAALAVSQAPRRRPWRLKTETPNSVSDHFRKLESVEFLTLDRQVGVERGLGKVCGQFVLDVRRTKKVHAILLQILRADASVGRSYPPREP